MRCVHRSTTPPRDRARAVAARGWAVAAVVVAAALGLAGAASACLPELGSSCRNEAATGFEAPPAFTDDELDDELRRTFALYLVGSRSDTEIHFSAAGPHPSARTRPVADGRRHCLISGRPARDAGADREAARPMLASTYWPL